MGLNYLSITELQRLRRWSLGIDVISSHTSLDMDYLSMLGLKLNHVSERGSRGVVESIDGIFKWVAVISDSGGRFIEDVWFVIKIYGRPGGSLRGNSL